MKLSLRKKAFHFYSGYFELLLWELGCENFVVGTTLLELRCENFVLNLPLSYLFLTSLTL